MSRQSLVEVLKTRIGLDPESLGERVLEQSLHAAASELGLASLDSLYQRVLIDKPALQTLIEHVVVPETWLLRGREQFEQLVAFALDRPAGTRLRILSLPCASGEEAWSIAASLFDAGIAPSRFDVVGIDVSERAIALARAGRYRPAALRGGQASGNGLAEHAGCILPHAALRASVSFRVGNGLDPGVFAPGECFDVIFCRNLLIYLDPLARRSLVARLLEVLADDGVVYTGQAENLAAIDPRLRTAPGQGVLAFVRQATRSAAPVIARVTPPTLPPTRSSGRRSGAAQVSPVPAAATGLQGIAPPAHDPLALAREMADRGQLEPARDLLRSALGRDATQAAYWRLLGLVEMARDALGEADEAFSRALFLDRDDEESLRHRAMLATRLARPEEARELEARWQRRGAAER